MKHGFKKIRAEHTPTWMGFHDSYECQIQNQKNKDKIATKRNSRYKNSRLEEQRQTQRNTEKIHRKENVKCWEGKDTKFYLFHLFFKGMKKYRLSHTNRTWMGLLWVDLTYQKCCKKFFKQKKNYIAQRLHSTGRKVAEQ